MTGVLEERAPYTPGPDYETQRAEIIQRINRLSDEQRSDLLDKIIALTIDVEQPIGEGDSE